MWTTDAHIPDAIEVMSAWGFKYKTVAFIWNKKREKRKTSLLYGAMDYERKRLFY